jgi:transcriptional regulator with XRE-family HTH domain
MKAQTRRRDLRCAACAVRVSSTRFDESGGAIAASILARVECLGRDVTPDCHEPELPATVPPAGGSLGMEPEGFGPRLRRERERRGISLDAIAKSTKIKSSLLVGLERDDVSQWPSGIFRRAFMREYAAAIGLSPEPLVTEFLERFPEPDAVDQPRSLPNRESSPEPRILRLTVDPDPAWGVVSVAHRLVAASLDAAVIAVAAGLVWFFADLNIWLAGTIVTLTYYSMATALVGRSFASWLLRVDSHIRRRRALRRRARANLAPGRLFDFGSGPVERTPVGREPADEVGAGAASALTH